MGYGEITKYPIQPTRLIHVDEHCAGSFARNGSLERPYRFVQDALDRAMELMEPDTAPDEIDYAIAVQLLPGRYEEDCEFVFPHKYRNLSIQGVGHRGDATIQSLSIQAADETTAYWPGQPWMSARNEFHASRLRFGAEDNPKPALDLWCPGHARMEAFCWACHFFGDSSVVPILRAARQTAGSLYLHLCNANWLHRYSSTLGDTPAILLDGAHFDFEAGRMENYSPAALIQSSGNLDIQNSILTSQSGRPIRLTGGSQAVLSGVKILARDTDAILHEGALGGGGFVLLHGVMFSLTTGLAVNAPYGAAVFIAPTTWDGYMGGGAGIETKIAVADPALLRRLQTAAITGYTPSQASDWNPLALPANLQAALDELASRVKTLETS